MGEHALKGIVLDRDGTLIDVVRDEETGAVVTAFHPSQVRLLDGVVDGLRALRDAGYAFAIATNQPGPAKGHFSAAAIVRTNTALTELLSREGIVVASVEVCMHHPVGAAGGDPALIGSCECRKPKPGLVRRAAAAMGVPVGSCWMIGDHASDIGAAHAAGARAALIFDPRRCELCPLRSGPEGIAPDAVGPDLVTIAARIVAHER